MKDEEIKAIVHSAIKKLLEEDHYLLQYDLNERAISHRLGIYIEQNFQASEFEYDVDCEYNKTLDNSKMISVGKILPDVIVHKRGRMHDNILVVEVKKTKTSNSDKKDQLKLEELTDQQGEFRYRIGLRLVLPTGDNMEEDKIKLEWYKNGVASSVETQEADMLVEKLAEFFKKYGFCVEKELSIPSSKFSSRVFQTESDLDLYCHSKPFRKEVINGEGTTEVLVSDFVVECKSGINLSDDDKKKIVEKSNFMPIYVCFQEKLFEKISSQDIAFLKSNKIGIMTFDIDKEKIRIREAARAKVEIEGKYPLGKVIRDVPHLIFEVFRCESAGSENLLYLPCELFLGSDPLQRHVLRGIDSLNGLIGIRKSLITRFEREGYGAVESWVFNTAMQDYKYDFHGFNVHSLIYTLDNMFDFYAMHGRLGKKNKISGIILSDKELDWFYHPWNNEDFVYCICFEKGTDHLVFFIRCNVKYYGSIPQFSFGQPTIYAPFQIGDNMRKDIDVEKIESYDNHEKTVTFHGEMISDAKLDGTLVYLQCVSKNFENGENSTKSESPGFYFYNGKNGIFVIQNYDVNQEIWDQETFKLEPKGGFARCYELEGAVLTSSRHYQEFLD